MDDPFKGPGSVSSEPIAEMNVIPFIDICLVLLIIVLVTASFSTKLLSFSHPQASEHPTEFIEAREAVAVTVAANGTCTVNGKSMAVEKLGQAIQSLKGPKGFPSFVLRASGTTETKHVLAALGQIRTVGEISISMALEYLRLPKVSAASLPAGGNDKLK